MRWDQKNEQQVYIQTKYTENKIIYSALFIIEDFILKQENDKNILEKKKIIF